MNYQKTEANIIKGIKNHFKKCNIKKAVIGLSGGIDSSLSLTLVAKAIGPENVFGILMPEKNISSLENFNHAKLIAEKNNVKYTIIPIIEFLKPFRKIMWKYSKIADINIKARIRANILYHYANTHNSLVIGTSNKTELLLGYFTKYGDGAVDVEVIGDLWKTEVVELSKHLKIPKDIINKPPTAELYHGHTDEEELGGDYNDIDKLLKNILKGKEPKGKLANNIKRLYKQNRHKTLPIPLIKAKE